MVWMCRVRLGVRSLRDIWGVSSLELLQSCCEQSRTGSYIDNSFNFSGIYAWVHFLGFVLIACLGLYIAKRFQGRPCHFTLLPVMSESSSFCTSSPTCGIVTIFFFILALLIGIEGYLTVVLIGISLMWCWKSRHMGFFFHLCIFISQMSLHVLCPFLNWAVSLLLNFDTVVINLSNAWLTNPFSQSVA